MESVELRILLKALGVDSLDSLTSKLAGLKNEALTAGGELDKLSASGSRLTPMMKGLGLAVAGVAAAAAAGAVAAGNLVLKQAELARQTVDLADKLSLTVGQTERLQFIAERTGSNITGLGGAINTINRALTESGGRGRVAADALRALGVATVDAQGKQREAGNVLLDTIKRLAQINTESTRTELAIRTLGSSSAENLKGLLKNFDEASAAATRFGIGVDEAATKRLAETNKKVTDLKAALQELKKALADTLDPIVIRVVTQLTQVVNGEAPSAQRNLFFDPLVEGVTTASILAGAVTPTIASDARRLLDSRLPSAAGLLDPRTPALPSRPGRTARSPQQKQFESVLDAITYGNNSGRDVLNFFTARAGRSSSRASAASVLPFFDVRGTFFASPVAVDTDQQDQAFGAGILQREQSRLAIERSILATRERLVELLAGPGGEVQAARTIRDLRISTARDEVELAQANLDYQVRIAEISRRQREEFRQGLGSTFDALTAGGAGIRGYLSGFARTTGRTIFQNVGTDLFGGLAGRFALPGQTNGSGGLNFLGRALQGTVLGVSPEKLATDANTAATNANTAALIAAAGGNPASVAGLTGGVASALGLGNIFSGVSRTNPLILSANGRAGQGGTPIVNELGDIEGYVSGQSSAFGRGVGISASLAGGAIGVLSGIRQGGARGAVTAAASASGAFAGLASFIPALGPAAPFAAAGALLLGLGGSLFPDPKKTRDAAINGEIDSRRFTDFSGTSYSTDRFGRGFDSNFRGDLRPIVVNFNAVDAASLMDRRDDLTEVVRVAMSEGHPIVKEIQGAVIPAS